MGGINKQYGIALVEVLLVLLTASVITGVSIMLYRTAHTDQIAAKIISQTLNTAQRIHARRQSEVGYQWLSTTASYTWAAYYQGLYDPSIERYSAPVLLHAGGEPFRLNDVPQTNMIPTGYARADAYRIMVYRITRPGSCLQIVNALVDSFDAVSIAYVPVKGPTTDFEYDEAKAKQYCNNYSTPAHLQFVTY